jgi:predicted anti-sigma-YlaC factor YlaD
MNCRHFARIFADYQEGKLPPDEQSAADAHLRRCPSCRRLLDVARGSVDILPENRRDELARAILDRTSGSPCRRVESFLWDFVEGRLGAADSQLVALHLNHCADCRALADELAMMQEVLPAIAVIDPGTSFTNEVVYATSRSRPERPDLEIRIRAWWNRMILHPLFSCQTAYVGAVVLLIAFSSPFLPFWQSAYNTIFSAAIQPAANYVSSIWSAPAAPDTNQAHEFASAVHEKKQATAEWLGRLGESYENMSASMLSRTVRSIRVWRQRQEVALLTFWIRLTNSMSRPG